MVSAAIPQFKTWTYDELVALNDETRWEGYDGELFEMSSPTVMHQKIIGRLYRSLMAWVDENGGQVHLSPIDLLVSQTRFFVPDLCYYTAERVQNERIERDDGRCLIAPPDLIVEIISPSTARNDRVRKTRLYAEFGVRNYWIIDPELKTIETFALQDGFFVLRAAFAENDILESPLFPGLQTPLETLFNS